VQRAVRAALQDLSGEDCDEYAIDGCSAPNFALSLEGFARALAAFAAAEDAGMRGKAMRRLTTAMMRHPEYVSGEGGACTRLMRAMAGRAVVKTGAEGVFAAIIPEQRLGIAVKIEDGAGRASEAVIAALLVRAGVLDADHPEARLLTPRADPQPAGHRDRPYGGIRRDRGLDAVAVAYAPPSGA
jgi:L-asparaginase II